MKKMFILLVLSQIYITAQVITAVAPLNVGNKWVYNSSVVFQNRIVTYEVCDSIKIINGIQFHAVLSGPEFPFLNYMTLKNNFWLRYDEEISDSLYTYFKESPQKGDIWIQHWKNGTILQNTITDTLESVIFGLPVIVYVLDRVDINSPIGSREYWTKEFGMIQGEYEQATDRLSGCIIDGVLYGDTTTVGIDDNNQLLKDFVLHQNYPNPFNPSTNIKWELKGSDHVVLKVFNILGKEIKTLVDKYYNPGIHEIKFNADNLPSGIYIYRLITTNFHETRKMVLLR